MVVLETVRFFVQNVVQPAFDAITYLFNPIGAQWFERRRGEASEAKLEERLLELSETMGRSAALMTEVEAALTVRHATVERLKVEAENAQRLAALTLEQRTAVATLLRGEVAREGRKTLWQGAAVNAFFFVAGILAAMWLGK